MSWLMRILITPDPNCWKMLPWDTQIERVSDWELDEA